MSDKILIVDDIDVNRMVLNEILSDDYEILEAENGIEAIDILYNSITLPSIVLLDIMMPEMDGYEVLSLIKSNELTTNIPVIFITAADADTNETKGLTEGAIDFISKPFNPDVVKARVKNHLELKRYRDELESMVKQKVDELLETNDKMLEMLATTIEYRNLESGGHVKRTSELTKIIVYRLLSSSKYREELLENYYEVMIKAASLHDIGKIGIPDNILLKPGPERLTEDEFNIMKTHAALGYEMLKSLKITQDPVYLKHCSDICRYHHERWDGKGYPDGLEGDHIPLSARICSVVDVYDALISKRCYKPAFTKAESLEIINSGAGTQFDPYVVQALNDVESEVEQMYKLQGED